MSEWELLRDAEGIEVGDNVMVETEDGRVLRLESRALDQKNHCSKRRVPRNPP